MEEKLDKQQLLKRRNVLKTKMDLRRLFIQSDRIIIKSSLKSIDAHKREFKQFQKEYLELLELL